MQITTYLSFKGECEAAFAFYERCLGGERGAIFRYGGSPMADQVPAGWQDKIMHGSLTVGGQVLMGADVAPTNYEEPKGFSLSIQIKSTADAERIFYELARDGRVLMPLEKTFWADRFGMVVDRFGIPWLINCEGSGQPPLSDPEWSQIPLTSSKKGAEYLLLCRIRDGRLAPNWAPMGATNEQLFGREDGWLGPVRK